MLDESEEPDLYELAFVPGFYRCPSCDLVFSKPTIHEGRARPADRLREPQGGLCPNDGTILVHVSYREQVEAYSNQLKEESNRFQSHTRTFEGLLAELYGVMVDPFAKGLSTVEETLASLLLAALRQRQESEDFHTILVALRSAKATIASWDGPPGLHLCERNASEIRLINAALAAGEGTPDRRRP